MPPAPTLHASMGAQLTRRRLEVRLHRLEAVAGALRRRADGHPAPELIGRAITGFEREMEAARRQLRRLPPTRS